MVHMLPGLLNLALLFSIGYSAELSLPESPLPETSHCRAADPSQSILVPVVAAQPDGDREYVDDNDNSDETSSAKERTVEFGGSVTRSARSLFRTKLQLTAHTSHDASVPLFYAFCTLLI